MNLCSISAGNQGEKNCVSLEEGGKNGTNLLLQVSKVLPTAREESQAVGSSPE